MEADIVFFLNPDRLIKLSNFSAEWQSEVNGGCVTGLRSQRNICSQSQNGTCVR
jgi:hypothetical protein